jgi:putative ABC transport system ATP-binding protein
VTLTVEDLTIEYSSGGYAVRPIDHLNLEAHPGELVVVLGASGCGKTSLLSVLAGILTPASGRFRRDQVGLIFQSFNLIPSLTAVQNVQAPLMMGGVPRRQAKHRALELLEQIGMGERGHHRPGQLSGGQQQRVAIARALAFDPPLVLADEPTAHLDYVQVEGVVSLLRRLADSKRVVVVATHDERLLPLADRVIELTPRRSLPNRTPITRTLAMGEVLFRQGDASDLVYEIESGAVEVVHELAGGGEELVTTLTAGVYVGELGPLLGTRRSATVRATTAARLVGYSPKAFKRRLDGSDGSDGSASLDLTEDGVLSSA